MNPEQMSHLMRRAQAMKHQMNGQLQRIITPRSPLLICWKAWALERDYDSVACVRLNPALEYHCGLQFHTCEQLLRWLKPEAQMLENESWPAESYRDKRFNRPLSADDLKQFCADYPGRGADK